MRASSFRTAFLAVAVAVVLTLSVLTPSFADDRFRDVVHAQLLYEHVLRLGMGGPYSGPYTAPLHTDPTGPSYLWGGLDPISVLDRYDADIVTDRGGVVFISRTGGDLGSPANSLEVPIYPGGPTRTALFRSPANRDRFIQMTEGGSLMIMFGLNCQWGIVSGPATSGARASHWAQPGLAAIAVERFFRGSVTVLGVNLYSRGDDWNATRRQHWPWAIEAFQSLIDNPDEQWERERPEMPVIKVN